MFGNALGIGIDGLLNEQMLQNQACHAYYNQLQGLGLGFNQQLQAVGAQTNPDDHLLVLLCEE